MAIFDSTKVNFSNNERPTGIVEGVQISNMEYSVFNNGRLEITVSIHGTDYKTYVFCPDESTYKTEKSYEKACIKAMKRILEVIWVFYPDKPKWSGDTFADFCNQALLRYKEAKDKDKVKCYCVMTYANNGFYGLRQSPYVPNIERMEEGKSCTLIIQDGDMLSKPANPNYGQMPDNSDSMPF